MPPLESKVNQLFTQANAALSRGNLDEAAEIAERGLALERAHPFLGLVRAVVDHRLGRTTLAVERLRALLAQNPSNAVEITIMLAEVLSRSGRRSEADALLASRTDWKTDERGALLEARQLARSDRPQAIEKLISCVAHSKHVSFKRIAGFEAVRMLDADARYREAFELADSIHQQTTPPFDILGVEADAHEQLRLLSRAVRVGAGPYTRRALPPDCNQTAMIVGLPRSGTTLVEQMLDRHPSISGIGEFEGVSNLGEALVSKGVWPDRLRDLSARDASHLQSEYLAGAHARRRAGASHTFDKTLRAWRLLPAVAAVLPGISLVHIEREARDCAISMFLSNFHPNSFGFTANLDMIRRVIVAERKLVAPSFEALALRAVRVRYEALVASPEVEIRRVLEHLGVGFDQRVMSPEANERTVLTLSHEQVRRKINNASIGRWKNYAFAFDAQWDSLDFA